MPIEGLHHFNLRGSASQLRTLRRFYCDVLGLIDGPRPAFRVPGSWLYAGDAPIVHLLEIDASESLAEPSQSHSALDHVALRCSGLDTMLERLREHGIEYRVTQVPQTRQTQVFCTDPFGMGVELNFSS